MFRFLMQFMVIIGVIMPFHSAAQTLVQPSHTLDERIQIGVVAATSGTFTVSYEEIGREAITGAKIYIGDVIETTASGKMQILLKDRTTLTIAPSSRLVIDEFIYDPGVERNVTSTLFKGVIKCLRPGFPSPLNQHGNWCCQTLSLRLEELNF